MARSVVNCPSPRCARCLLPPRWCVCPWQRTVACPVGVDILVDRAESGRPSSTGLLLQRVVPDARRHIIDRGRASARAEICRPGRDVWVLHPRGDPPPAGARAADLQVLLLDGSWQEAQTMLRGVEAWGRKVRLPMAGQSRFWLRAQRTDGCFSTIETLAFLLGALGFAEEQTGLTSQLELHVYAGLLARGKVAEADAFLASSPAQETLAAAAESLRG